MIVVFSSFSDVVIIIACETQKQSNKLRSLCLPVDFVNEYIRGRFLCLLLKSID